jgi:Fic family protein
MADDPRTIPPFVNLRRFSPRVTHELGRINASLERIRGAEVRPAAAEALRFSAKVGTIHYTTLIEGNRLGVLDAQRAARGELDARTKAELELVNQVEAVSVLDGFLETRAPFDEDVVLKLHGALTRGLGKDDEPFKPRHEGDWRDGEAVVFDPLTNEIMHTGSPQPEVRPRMLGLLAWLERKEADPVEWPPPVLAALVHFNVAEIHPFADGNGRMSRLLATAVLARHGYVPGDLFNFDAHYGTDKDAYLRALRTVRRDTLNQEEWVRYCLAGYADEYERVGQEISRLGAIGKTASGKHVQLTPSAQRGLTELMIQNRSEFDRGAYIQAARVSSSTATRDLKKLSDAGVLIRVGGGPHQRYHFASSPPPNPWETKVAGRPLDWTDERIAAELAALIGESETFPTIKQFDEADKRSLYQAIARRGGSRTWARKVGVPPPARGPRPKEA